MKTKTTYFYEFQDKVGLQLNKEPFQVEFYSHQDALDYINGNTDKEQFDLEGDEFGANPIVESHFTHIRVTVI